MGSGFFFTHNAIFWQVSAICKKQLLLIFRQSGYIISIKKTSRSQKEIENALETPKVLGFLRLKTKCRFSRLCFTHPLTHYLLLKSVWEITKKCDLLKWCMLTTYRVSLADIMRWIQLNNALWHCILSFQAYIVQLSSASWILLLTHTNTVRVQLRDHILHISWQFKVSSQETRLKLIPQFKGQYFLQNKSKNPLAFQIFLNYSSPSKVNQQGQWRMN